MDTSVSEGSLKDEIQFLTNLIKTHHGQKRRSVSAAAEVVNTHIGCSLVVTNEYCITAGLRLECHCFAEGGCSLSSMFFMPLILHCRYCCLTYSTTQFLQLHLLHECRNRRKERSRGKPNLVYKPQHNTSQPSPIPSVSGGPPASAPKPSNHHKQLIPTSTGQRQRLFNFQASSLLIKKEPLSPSSKTVTSLVIKKEPLSPSSKAVTSTSKPNVSSIKNLVSSPSTSSSAAAQSNSTLAECAAAPRESQCPGNYVPIRIKRKRTSSIETSSVEIPKLKRKLKSSNHTWKPASKTTASETPTLSSALTPPSGTTIKKQVAPPTRATPSSQTHAYPLSRSARRRLRRRNSSANSVAPPINNTSNSTSAKKKRRRRFYRKTASYYKNKVWVPAQSTQEKPEVETEVVFLSLSPLKHVQKSTVKVGLVGSEQPAQLAGLEGHERKTRQGNRQWTVAGTSDKTISKDQPADTGTAKPVKTAAIEKQSSMNKPVGVTILKKVTVLAKKSPSNLVTRDQPLPIESATPNDRHQVETVQPFPLGHEKKTRQGNKQWVLASAQQRPNQRVSEKDTVKLIVGHEKKTRQGNKQWIVSGKSVTRKIVVGSGKTPVNSGLVGHEKKTRRGNKQWVVAGKHYSRRTPVKPVRLVGHEKKTRRGNKQWVVAGLTPRRRTPLRSNLSTKHFSSLVSFNGGRYTMDRSGKRLKRLSTSSSQLACLSPAISGYLGGMASSSAKRMKANRVVKKSKAFVWHARMKSKQFCLFFNRFGKCNKGKDCPYIHDPDKIAVCTKFLRGACEHTDGSCPFSHKISKEKMPVCSFFLRGVCSREDCPYLHVSVGRDAKVCPDFLKGYCSRGEKCTMQHVLDCPQYSLTGVCPDGLKCSLRHTKKPRQLATPTLVKEPTAFRRIRCKHRLLADCASEAEESEATAVQSGKQERQQSAGPITSTELDFIPLELGAAPDFIPL